MARVPRPFFCHLLPSPSQDRRYQPFSLTSRRLAERTQWAAVRLGGRTPCVSAGSTRRTTIKSEKAIPGPRRVAAISHPQGFGDCPVGRESVGQYHYLDSCDVIFLSRFRMISRFRRASG